jgi:hypothetical protein
LGFGIFYLLFIIMATYLAGVTDLVPQIAPYQPDFGLVQKALSTLQSRYDQGFASVKNVYNQVLNAPLSDGANQQMKDGFLKEAQSRLKSLSSVDLSLPENQASAEGVFAPFWEDKLILQDANVTQWYQSELQKAAEVGHSKDEKVRSQYSDVAVQYLQNGLQKLREAGRDSTRYAQLEQRRFVPFQDIQTYLDERATKEGLKIEWDAPMGPKMLTTTGGPESAGSFATFAHNALGDQFADQFRVMGVVDKEERIRNLKRNNPGLTDEGALNLMATSIVQDLKKNYSTKYTAIKNDLEQVDELLKGYGKGVLTDAQKQEANTLLSRKEMLNTMLTQNGNELERLKDEKIAVKNIAEAPDGYFASAMKERAVGSWANARAANQQVHVGLNTVWKGEADVAYQKALLDQKDRDYAFEREKWDWEKTHPGLKSGKGASGGKGGYGRYPGEVINPESVGKYQGYGEEDITHTGVALDRAVQNQQMLWDTAHRLIFDIHTGVGSVLHSLQVTDNEAGRYMDVMQRMSDNPELKMSEEEKQLFKSVGEKLKGYTSLDASKDFVSARTALLKAAQRRSGERTATGGANLSDTDNALLTSYSDATALLETYAAHERERQRLVQQEVAARPGTYDKILVDRNGKKDLATADDFKGAFHSGYSLMIGGEALTPRQLAEAYISGQLQTTYQGPNEPLGIEFRGQRYTGVYISPEQKGGVKPIDPDAKEFNDQMGRLVADLGKLMETHGASEGQKDLREKLSKRVAPYIPEYQNKTGRMGVEVRFDLDDEVQGETAATMVNEAANAANREGIYIGKEYSQKSSTNKAVIELLRQGREELKKYVSALLLQTNGVNHRPSLHIVVAPANKNSKMVIGDMDLTELAGKTIDIDLSPHPSGDALRQIRYNSGFYVYGDVLNGGEYKSDSLMEAAGYRFTMSGNRGTSSDGVMIRYARKKFNMETGELEWQPEETMGYSFDEKNPDELMGFMRSQFQSHLYENAENRKRYQQLHPQLQTLEQLQKEREQARLGGK